MKAGKVKGLDPTGPLRANAARIIETRLEEMLCFADTASEPAEGTAQHDMRIAAKRLRYVLEITEGCFGAEARRARKAARDLQGVLGDIHDCDVMAPRVAEQIERAGGEDAGDGLELLANHIDGRRALLFVKFLELLHDQQSAGIWSELRRAVHS